MTLYWLHCARRTRASGIRNVIAQPFNVNTISLSKTTTSHTDENMFSNSLKRYKTSHVLWIIQTEAPGCLDRKAVIAVEVAITRVRNELEPFVWTVRRASDAGDNAQGIEFGVVLLNLCNGSFSPAGFRHLLAALQSRCLSFVVER